MTYQKFIEAWYDTVLPDKEPEIRMGQSFMIHLQESWPEEYKRLSSVHYYAETNLDCFFLDSLIPKTMSHLEKIWYKYPN